MGARMRGSALTAARSGLWASPALERFLRRLQVSRGSSRLGDPSNLTLSPHPVIGKEGFLEEAVPKLEFECQGETCCEKM